MLKKCLAEFSLILVGGGVRDYLLDGIIPDDLDFEIRHTDFGLFSPGEFKKLIEQEKIFEEVSVLPFNIIRIIYKGGTIELAPPRKEVFSSKDFFKHSEFQAEISFNLPYHKAWIRRDLTINAIGIDLNSQELIDPFNGIDDLQKKRLNACEKKTFVYDPVRFLRLIRFQLKLKFSLHPNLQGQLKSFDLRGLSSTYFVKEAFKSPNFFDFVRQFFFAVEHYNIPLPKEIKFLSFLGNLEIKFTPKTPDQLLLCLIYNNAPATKEQINFFVKYLQLKKSICKKHERFRMILEDFFEVKENSFWHQLERLPLNDFIRLKEVHLLKQFHNDYSGYVDKIFLEILEECNPELFTTYQKIQTLVPQSLKGAKEFKELIKKKNIPKKYRGELQIYCHFKASRGPNSEI